MVQCAAFGRNNKSSNPCVEGVVVIHTFHSFPIKWPELLKNCVTKLDWNSSAFPDMSYSTYVTVIRLARSNAFRDKQRPERAEKGPGYNSHPNRREARNFVIDVARSLVITETVHSLTPSAACVIVEDTYRVCVGRLGSHSDKEKWLDTR